VVEGAGLENQCGATHRGFESLPLRQQNIPACLGCFVGRGRLIINLLYWVHENKECEVAQMLVFAYLIRQPAETKLSSSDPPTGGERIPPSPPSKNYRSSTFHVTQSVRSYGLCNKSFCINASIHWSHKTDAFQSNQSNPSLKTICPSLSGLFY
jgi:hypothetical protein